MAKKNKAKKVQKPSVSPERFMRERARKLPIGKCFITPDWKESGLAQVYVSRIREDGKIALGVFLVDTFCLGVKDTQYFADLTEGEFKQMLENVKRALNIEEISYNEAHNIIYGAISFAAEGGIDPHKSFGIAGFVLERDTDDVPLIEYDFGKDGRHFLIVGDRSEMHYLNTLKKTLGDDFEYSVEIEDEEDDDFFGLNNSPIFKTYAEEEYSYEYPEYPSVLSVKNQMIADELLSSKNYNTLPRDVIERILALPKDEAAEDISNLIKYVIGQTYKKINDGTIEDADNVALIHSVMLLTQLGSEKGLEGLLEIMRQNEAFVDYHFGDLVTEIMCYAVYACGKDHVDALVSYLYQSGFYTYLREQVAQALCMIAFNHPERRSEIIEIFRNLLKSMVDRLPRNEACDPTFAGLLICDLIDIRAKELIPEIKEVFATDCVDLGTCGDLDSVLKDIQDAASPMDEKKFKLPNI